MQGALRRHRRYDVGETWAGWGSITVVFFHWDGRSPVPHNTCDIPFPPRSTGRYRKRMISARLSYQGVRRSVWDPETFAQAEARPTGRTVSKERLGDWDGPMEV
jgi:hypothetical protein